jgi:D-glycero-D-manno-heptose 1,7-bisphosphate phosphatase
MSFDKSWTLFLDRDGVINRKRDNDYVKRWEEFEFLPGALEALASLEKVFGHILIVTNQQGIGKGIYTVDDLNEVHRRMMEQIEKAGGRIDRIYFCPGLAKDDPPCRKPNTGMALDAKRDFPSIDLSRSVIVGDSMSDMEMGRNAGMHTVFISEAPKRSPLIDLHFDSLLAFSRAAVS